ncbi:unnamed protein product [Schistosoma mattheei]|uniref:Uncharacterized protein n=1 Tax=Schistosoma mattheei TaxID=31246 RepID=A0A183Q812_9TREM|nr:unnamed protein product [Schistosoma mattheei]
MATDTINSIMNNNNNNKIDPNYFTQSLKLKKSEKFDNSMNLLNASMNDDNKHDHNSNEINQLKTARSWEYIVIPHNNNNNNNNNQVSYNIDCLFIYR